MNTLRHHAKPTRLALACLASLCLGQDALAWNWGTLTNPNWEIQLTDAGYSDYLFDQTPGFVGREYLSGEWGAAVGYGKASGAVQPLWLEPVFSFPDWPTNSNFTTQSPISVSLKADGLPESFSVIANDDLRITQHVEMVDTLIGTPMGTSAASAASGGRLMSNRYVMVQSYTMENTSSETLSNLQFFQMLHGLNSQMGVYDNRAYAGPMANYQYDVTLGGVDYSSVAGQYDYIGFHAQVAPTAVELGYYGDKAVDDHSSTGKPSVGTHLSIEANSLTGADSVATDQYWVAGAQRWDMGSLAPGQSATMDVMLTILTGWEVAPSPDGSASGSTNGAADNSPGGVDYSFDAVTDPGLLFVDYEAEDWDSIQQMIALGEIGPLSFAIPGDRLQLFEVEFEGSFDGQLILTFHYDPTLLPAEFNVADLRVFHWTGSQWENLGGTVDPLNHTITAYTDSLSPFAVAAVPEPESYLLLLAGLAGIAWRVRGKR